MVAAYIRELHTREWWPYGSGDVAGIWLTADVGANPPTLIPLLLEAAPDMRWFGLQTLFHRSDQPGEARVGAASRVRRLASTELQLPRNVTARAEWFEFDPSSAMLGELVMRARKGRGKGTAAAVSDDARHDEWVALSYGLVWRAIMAMGSAARQGYQQTNSEIVATVMATLSANGFAWVVPLDGDPSDGIAVIGSSEILDGIASRIDLDHTGANEVGRLNLGDGGLAL